MKITLGYVPLILFGCRAAGRPGAKRGRLHEPGLTGGALVTLDRLAKVISTVAKASVV